MEAIKQMKKARLISELKQKGGYANNTVYYKELRAHQLALMVNDLTYFLYDGQKSLSDDEQHILTSLIRSISYVLAEKSAENKKAVISALNEYEALNV